MWCKIWVDLIILHVVYFYFILGMDQLAPCHDILGCYTNIMTLATPGMLRLSWKVTLNLGIKGVTSFLHANYIVEMGYLSYLSYIRDTSIVSLPPLESTQVVCEFMDMLYIYIYIFLICLRTTILILRLMLKPTPSPFLFLHIGLRRLS